MNLMWNPDEEMPLDPPGLAGWAVAVPRAVVLCLILIAGVSTMALLRMVERPVHGERRPWTPFITQGVCRAAFVVLGIGYRSEGKTMKEAGAVVANHASWLDIFALNARKRIYFVSKAEVAGWPGIGLLAKITGTVFIARDPRQAKQQTELFETRLNAGHKLLFFPEGTSTDSIRVIPFKTTLFQAFFSPELRHRMYVQPVSVVYRAPKGSDPRFYGWWGEMEFGPHLLHVLAARRQGSVTVIYHPPVKVEDFLDRKALAAHLEAQVRAGMPPERRIGA